MRLEAEEFTDEDKGGKYLNEGRATGRMIRSVLNLSRGERVAGSCAARDRVGASHRTTGVPYLGRRHGATPARLPETCVTKRS